MAEDDEQAMLIAKKLLSFLPQNNTEDPPEVEHDGNVDGDDLTLTVCSGHEIAAIERHVHLDVLHEGRKVVLDGVE